MIIDCELKERQQMEVERMKRKWMIFNGSKWLKVEANLSELLVVWINLHLNRLIQTEFWWIKTVKVWNVSQHFRLKSVWSFLFIKFFKFTISQHPCSEFNQSIILTASSWMKFLTNHPPILSLLFFSLDLNLKKPFSSKVKNDFLQPETIEIIDWDFWSVSIDESRVNSGGRLWVEQLSKTSTTSSSSLCGDS